MLEPSEMSMSNFSDAKASIRSDNQSFNQFKARKRNKYPPAIMSNLNSNPVHLFASVALLFLSALILVSPFPSQINLIGLRLASASNLSQSPQPDSKQISNNNNNFPNQTASTPSEFLLNLLVKTNFNQQNNNNNATGSQSSARLLSSFKPRLVQQREHMHYKTTYACEGNQLELGCQEGKLIHLVRANYGRFSLSICNELGHSNLSVQCASFRAFLIMETRCNKLSNCSVVVSKELFGDPCEGTSKYLEVQYYCDDATSNGQQQSASPATQQQQPPPPQAGQQAQQQPQQVISPISQSQQTNGKQSPAAPAQPAGSHKSPPNQPQLATNSASNSDLVGGQASGNPELELDAPSTVIQQPYCQAQTSARNLFWNATRAGQLARQACPEGATGKASWLCDLERARFSPAWSADFSQCKSSWLARLAQQLDQMLETPSIKFQLQQQQQPSAELIRQQNEQILKLVLNDLALMARTKELFSEDIKRIDIMISQIIAQLKSLSSLYGLAGSQQQPSQFVALYEELFVKLANIVSSLFDNAQRAAWLEIQPAEQRRRLEQRLLSHLKESGALLAISGGAPAEPLRLPNLFAGITVISNNNFNSPKLSHQQQQELSPESNEFNLQLKQSQLNLERFITEPDDQINEFRIHLSVLRELVASGTNRFLVLDIKKPDYSLIRQQLEAAYAMPMAANEAISANSLDGSAGLGSNLFLPDQQWTTRIFGVFAINGDNGDLLDGQANGGGSKLLADLLVQWPISVDFKINSASNPPSSRPILRQCNSFADTAHNLAHNQFASNRCHTLRSNSTNHVCRCDQFGFVALSSAPNQVPASSLQSTQDFLWPPAILAGSGSGAGAGQPLQDDQATYEEQMKVAAGMQLDLAPAYVGLGVPQNAKSQQQSVGVWTTIFILFGLSLLIVSLAGLIIGLIVRSSQSNLAKKHQGGSAGFLSGYFLSGNHQRSNGPTTAPLADHNLMGGDPLISTNGLASNSTTATTNTALSSSIVGLSQSASNCQGYKPQQQLYAAHLAPPLDTCRLGGRWSSWTHWLRPSNWLSGKPGDRMVQHRVLGSTLTNSGSVSYKSQYQNGYTTSLHHQQVSGGAQQLAQHLTLAGVPAQTSSSTSSYVSSSAYYEEIGPGNLTKVNTNQLTNHSRAHTIVDPFKRQLPPAADQQQLLSHQHHQHHHHLNQQQHQYQQQLHQHQHHHQQQQHESQMSQQVPIQQSWTATTNGAYTLEQHQQAGNQLQGSADNYGHPLAAVLSNKLQTDLNQLQSNGSSSNSQHSAATNQSTPRHYLFASPSAVSAYKSSISQHNSLGQQHQQFPHQDHHHHHLNNNQRFA